MNAILPKPNLQDYLDWELKQPERHFYYQGEIFAMTGARQNHASLSLNLGAALNTALRGGPCRAFISDMKVRIDLADAVFYPDIVVSCDERDRKTPYYLSHPSLIIEVLSNSTAAFDRGTKFAAYRQLESLKEYVLVDIEARRIEVFRKNPANIWELHEFKNTETLSMTSLGVQIPAELIYENIEAD